MSRNLGPKIICQCGKQFYSVNRDAHERSIAHQNYLVYGRMQNHIPQDERYVCECGKRLSVSMKDVHERSDTHKNYRKVQELLKDPTLTLQEIGMRAGGFSREYVRQIASQNKSWDGRKRQKIGTQRRHGVTK